mgnify:CR=1 FL=1
MNNHIYSFKSLGDNKYKMFYKNDSLGITFITPDGYSIEDYELYFTEEDFKPCKDVVIKLQNPPKTFKSINVASNADITFKDGLSFCVNNSITLAKNKNLLFCAKDGVKEVVVDNLMVKKNKSSSFTFYPTPQGATTRDDKRLKGKGYPFDAVFKNNERVDLKFQDQFVVLYIESLTSNKPYSITLDCTSSVFVTSDVGTFNVNKYDAEVKFKADRVEFSYTTFKVEDSLKNSAAIFENISDDKDKLSSISFLGGYIEVVGAAHITTDAKKLIINQQGNNSKDFVSFLGQSFINAKEQVSIINGIFNGDNKIKSSSKELTFLSDNIANIIKDSVINIVPKTKKGENDIEISDLKVNYSFLDNIKADSLSGDISNAKITNCEIGDISSINIVFSDPSLPTYTTHINNLVLAKSSHLFLRSGVAVESERVINNCLVEEGKFSILDDGDYEISNSTLGNGEIFLNNETGLVTISNSNIQGSNGIKNITSVDCSILKDAIIYSSEPIEVRDEMVVDKKILDYSTHLAQPNQKEVSQNSIITKEIEIL